MVARLRALQLCFSLISASVLAACGGGGGSSSSALPNVLPPAGGNLTGNGSAAAPQAVAFSIAIPTATTSGVARRARYVSAGTKSIVVAYGGVQQSADCASTCSMTLSVLPGTVTFTVSLYDATGGKGNVLSTAQTTTTITAGAPNRVALVFGGVVAALTVALVPGSVPAGNAASVPVVVQAKDAAGYTIVGSDPYANPIQLSNDDPSGATSLSTTTVPNPSASVTLNYNGSPSATAAHVSASIPGTGVRSQPATLAVQAAAPQPPAPATGPVHIQTWYYYGGGDSPNRQVPMSWMAKHADFIENDGDFGAAFHAAGGKYVVRYTDPAYVPWCDPPFTPPVKGCIGAIGARVNTNESAWLHSADGARVHRADPYSGHYQEALNPKSQAARDAYHADTQAALDQWAGQIDYFFADDSGGVFTGSDGTQMTGHMYGFNAPVVEITTDADWLAALKQMLASAAKPVIINGVDTRTQFPAYDGALLDAPNVGGYMLEGCLSASNAVVGNSNNRWSEELNGMLMAYRHHSLAVCYMTADATPSNRLYEMASLWMAYDEKYTVAAPVAKLADTTSVVPEYDIVPRQPLKTAATDVNELKSSTGAFVREFAACYQGGASIGPCATIVNPSGGSVSMPPLSGHYTTSLVLNDASVIAGGTATWSGGVPSQLPSMGAVVLR